MSNIYFTNDGINTIAMFCGEKYIISDVDNMGLVTITHDPSGIAFWYKESEVSQAIEEISEVMGASKRKASK